MRAELIPAADERWQAFLRGCRHDFYHLPVYVELCARHGGGEAAAFWAEEGPCAMLAPMVLRPLPADLDPGLLWRDSVAPYGYPSPLLRGGPGEATVTGFLQAFREVGSAAGGLFAGTVRCANWRPPAE